MNKKAPLAADRGERPQASAVNAYGKANRFVRSPMAGPFCGRYGLPKATGFGRLSRCALTPSAGSVLLDEFEQRHVVVVRMIDIALLGRVIRDERNARAVAKIQCLDVSES
jgi:hypothetical protein